MSNGAKPLRRVTPWLDPRLWMTIALRSSCALLLLAALTTTAPGRGHRVLRPQPHHGTDDLDALHYELGHDPEWNLHADHHWGQWGPQPHHHGPAAR